MTTPERDVAAVKDELRALLAAATPGPWERLTHGTASQRDAAMRAAQAVMAHRLPDAPDIEFTDISWVDQADPEAPHIALTGNGPKSRENAALIVAAINALPLLLSSPDPVAGDGLREALQRLLDAAEFRRPSFDESGGEWIKARDLEWMAAVKHARAALAAPLSSPVEPPPGLDGPIGVEERVELARAMGRMQAEQEAVQAIGRIVMAAGGEVRVPDNLLVRDVTVDSDFVNGTTIYRARLLPTQASDSPETT